MATSQAEVSQRLRKTIREMVRRGKSNEEIYDYIAKNYGENQIAVPQNSWMKFLSMGLPYLLMGFIVVIATGFGWFWVKSDRPEDGEEDSLSQEKRDSIDRLVDQDEENPLR